jgi:hypothetical protein
MFRRECFCWNVFEFLVGVNIEVVGVHIEENASVGMFSSESLLSLGTQSSNLYTERSPQWIRQPF